MSKRYAGVGAAAVGTDKTILTLISATTVRPRLADILIGCGATPADLATIFHVQRFTAVGTEGSGYTPTPLDPDDPASACDCGVGTFTVEPTYTATGILLKLSMNQRATVRWVAAPGFELVAPATAGNGIGIKSSSSGGTASHEATILFEE